MSAIFDNTCFNAKNDPCADFLAHLDQWLAEELDAHDGVDMQLHHDACEACARETRLARGVDVAVRALPEKPCPALPLPAAPTVHGHDFISRLLSAWRQPLVFVPAFAALLAALVSIQMRAPSEPDTVVINGEEYSREEIMQAAQELDTALRYLDKYGSLPARVVTAEIEQSHLPLPAAQAADAPPTI